MSGAWRWLREHAVNIVAAMVVVYLLIPIAVILLFSFNDPQGRYNYTWVGFTFDHWAHAFSRPELNEALLTSLKLALLATLISTIIGTMMAIALVRHQFFGRRMANFLIVIPMATPEVVMGAALLSFFLIIGSPALGFQTLLIAHVMFCISFVVVVVRSRLIGFDRKLEEAAKDLGANAFATFRLVTLPLIVPGIFGAAMLAFALSIDDFVISNFNSGTTVTFPLYIFGAAQRGIPVEVNVIAMMLFGVTVLAMGLVDLAAAPRRTDDRSPSRAGVRPDLRAPHRRHRVMAGGAGREGTLDVSSDPPAAGRLRNYAGGEWVEVEGVEALADVDPVSGETSVEVPLSGSAEIGAAVEAARAAQPAWRETPPQKRARALLALRAELLRRRRELVELVSADMGKTLVDADGEVGRGIESVESAAAIPHLLKGDTLEGVADGVDVEMVRQPVGVVAAITPFNFPAMIPLWFLPYAIACGNAFILKPSELDPRPAALIVEMVDAVEEIPAGVVNLVHGGRDAVTAILEDPGIDAVSFVGRAETARIVAKGAVATGKRVQALGGAKNSLVVMPDADLGQALPAIMGSSFGAAGQRCLAGSVCVSVGDGARHRELREALVAAASELVVGDGRDPATDVCPMVSAAAREKVAAAIGRGRAGRSRAAPRRPRRRRAGRDGARPDDRASLPIARASWRARSSSGRC